MARGQVVYAILRYSLCMPPLRAFTGDLLEMAEMLRLLGKTAKTRVHLYSAGMKSGECVFYSRSHRQIFGSWHFPVYES